CLHPLVDVATAGIVREVLDLLGGITHRLGNLRRLTFQFGRGGGDGSGETLYCVDATGFLIFGSLAQLLPDARSKLRRLLLDGVACGLRCVFQIRRERSRDIGGSPTIAGGLRRLVKRWLNGNVAGGFACARS